ncbi:phosphatidylinositol 3- and 4-kinase family protein [Striga asiatica]|uniref:Phosphatidylinositol 3-and 4-kinase family protein n=1 Tax=Striga asiatica TaxID=4170 RepID=A0A5A7PCU0_STRAF|nr:phosphatidylinositol 3- and 4-kinase family protein [Striga asiatica]
MEDVVSESGGDRQDFPEEDCQGLLLKIMNMYQRWVSNSPSHLHEVSSMDRRLRVARNFESHRPDWYFNFVRSEILQISILMKVLVERLNVVSEEYMKVFEELAAITVKRDQLMSDLEYTSQETKVMKKNHEAIVLYLKDMLADVRRKLEQKKAKGKDIGSLEGTNQGEEKGIEIDKETEVADTTELVEMKRFACLRWVLKTLEKIIDEDSELDTDAKAMLMIGVEALVHAQSILQFDPSSALVLWASSKDVNPPYEKASNSHGVAYSRGRKPTDL